MPRILYIAGYGRSGSTVLDIALGNHPNVFAAGELDCLLDDIVAGGGCTCGESYIDCPTWGKVIRDLFDVDTVAAEARRLASDFDGLESGLRRSPATKEGPGADRLRAYGDFWGAVFGSIADHENAAMIVDSSKSAHGTARRLVELANRTGSDLRVIHLVRDPRAVLYSSWIRGNNIALEDRRTTAPSTLGLLRPLVGWLSANVAVTLARLRVRGLAVLPIHYEDFVENPGGTLDRIGTFADLDLSNVGRLIDDGEVLDAGHGVRGNRMRRSGPIHLRLDTEWITESPRSARVAGLAFAPFARAYGYSTLRWPRRSALAHDLDVDERTNS